MRQRFHCPTNPNPEKREVSIFSLLCAFYGQIILHSEAGTHSHINETICLLLKALENMARDSEYFVISAKASIPFQTHLWNPFFLKRSNSAKSIPASQNEEMLRMFQYRLSLPVLCVKRETLKQDIKIRMPLTDKMDNPFLSSRHFILAQTDSQTRSSGAGVSASFRGS